MGARIALLPERGVMVVQGEDRVGFLQGLVSNDVTLAAPGRAVWSAFLTPQGKWLADFFILAEDDRLLLDCERAQVPELVRLLRRYRLRSKVDLTDASDAFAVHAAWGAPPPGKGWVPDPRLRDAAWRCLATGPLSANADAADWDRHRLSLGLPDGSRDMEPGKSTLLEGGFDELHGVSWTKGCYMGQELTARTKYRGLLKRRLVPVDAEGPLPPPGTPVLRDGVQVGTMRSSRDSRGLALLQLDAFGAPLAAGDVTLRTDPPEWMTPLGRDGAKAAGQSAILTT